MERNWWAEQLRAERAAMGWSREELAEQAGVSVSTVRRMELAVRGGTIDNLSAMCEALGVSLVEFFERAEDRAESQRRREADNVTPLRSPSPLTSKAARVRKKPGE